MDCSVAFIKVASLLAETNSSLLAEFEPAKVVVVKTSAAAIVTRVNTRGYRISGTMALKGLEIICNFTRKSNAMLCN